MRTPARLAEILVLVVGGLSVVGTGWVALRAGEDPELVVELEVERGAERAAEILRLVWERRLARAAPPGVGPEVRGVLADLDEPTRSEPINRLGVGDRTEVFDVLLAEADRTGDRTAVAEALERYPDAGRRPEGWLRMIQLAVGAGDLEAARDAWLAARLELEPEGARGDVAYLLLDLLAAAPALSASERTAGQAELAELWAEGRLALPVPADTWVGERPEGQAVFDPRVEVLARALVELSSVHADAVNAAADHDGRALRVLLTSLGEPALPGAEGRWRWLFGHEDGMRPGPSWLVRVEADGRVALAECDPAELANSIEEEASLGAGFQLVVIPFSEFDADLEGSERVGTPTGRTVRIAGGDWPLHHLGRGELLADEVSRQRNLRLGFGLLAALTAVAVGFTYTALVRRRHLEELKSRFVAGVSHDLRTPLASILAMAENLESGRVQDAERVATYHGSIRREATRLGRMVDDVLDFSRLERGEGVKLVREEWQLSTLAEQLEVECRERVEKAGGELRVLRENLPESGVLDAEALRRAVGNLVDNALAHSGSTELELVLRGSGEALVIEVADAGCGVPHAQRERMFDAFEQGPSPNGHTGGSGLGLAIVRELARAHGGDATFVDQDVDEPDGQYGTRVRLTLCLTEEAPPA